MLRTRRLLALTMLAGCSDALPTVPASLVPQPAMHNEAEGPQDLPAGVPASADGPTSISVLISATFETFYDETHTYATANPFGSYEGTSATASASMSVHKSAALGGDSASAEGANGELHCAQLRFRIGGGCGHTVNAKIDGSAWNWYQPSFIWKKKIASGSGSDSQAACATGNTGSVGDDMPPEESPGGDCRWNRDFVIFEDGSWMWISGWYRECDGEMDMIPTDSTELAPRASALQTYGSSRTRVRVVDEARPKMDASIVVERSSKSDVDVDIRVDVSRMSERDLEAAFVVSGRLSERPKPKAGGFGRSLSASAQEESIIGSVGSRAHTTLVALRQMRAQGVHGRVDVLIDK